MKIKVIIKQPGRNPYSTWIENSLENLQDTVGGYIETFRKGGMICICNEEGKLQELPPNFYVFAKYDMIHGTVIFCGEDGEEFADCPKSYFEVKKMWPQLWNGDVATI